MSTSSRRRYQVGLVVWDTCCQWIEASSREEAIDLAIADYERHGDANFKLKDGGVEFADIWAEDEIV